MIALVDLNAFFASLEQMDKPWWQGRPLGVTNGMRGTCCITCSYEARRFGVKTGMHIKKARMLAPGLIQAPARPERYAEVSTRIMKVLEDVSPVIEVFSVDEAFLDLTHCQRYWKLDAWHIGRMIKEKIFEASGLLCSVGVSGDKTTAKWAAKQMKPNGLTVVEPWKAEETLAPLPVTDLCGIKAGIGGYLAQYGVEKCGDMKRIPMREVARRFGNPGKRYWLMAQGKDPDEIHTTVKDPKSLFHGKVIPPNTKDRAVLEVFLRHMCEKVGRRLRKYSYEAQEFSVGTMIETGWLWMRFKTEQPTQDGAVLYGFCNGFLDRVWKGQGVYQVHIGTPSPTHITGQNDLFAQPDARRDRLLAVIDSINVRYGEFAVMPAPLVNRSDMPNVISPAWKPGGHRETIGA